MYDHPATVYDKRHPSVGDKGSRKDLLRIIYHVCMIKEVSVGEQGSPKDLHSIIQCVCMIKGITVQTTVPCDTHHFGISASVQDAILDNVHNFRRGHIKVCESHR